MTLKVSYFLSLGNIKDFDLTVAVSNCDSVFITKRNWTNVVVDLAGLIKTGNLWWASWPKIKARVKSNSDLILLRPVDEVKIKIVLKIRCIKDLIRFFIDLAHLLLWVRLNLCKRLCDIAFILFLAWLLWTFFCKRHYLIVLLKVDLIEDSFIKKLLVVRPSWLSWRPIVVDLKRTGADLAWYEPVSSRLALQIFLVF